MISTVVSSTVTSTVTVVTDVGIVLGLVAVIALVAFLCVKELATASAEGTRRPLSKFIDIGVVPLTIVFAMIVAMEIIKIVA